MIVLVQATVLTVGLNGRNKLLRQLPVRILAMRSGADAVRHLKNEKVDSVISQWNLEDMHDGRFVKKLRAAKPHIPTIVFVRPNDKTEEVSARSLGVSAVLTDDTSDELFCKTVADVLGLKDVVEIEAVSSVKEQTIRDTLR